MKQFLFYICLIVTLYSIGYINNNKYRYEFMDKIHTNIIKSIAILLVVTAHVDAYWSKVGGLQFIGGIGVSLFLICSGYGLYCSYSSSGLKNYFKKKIVKIWIPYLLVEILFMPMWNNISIKKVVLDLLLIKPSTSFGWYMNYIMVCYIIFYFVITIKEKKKFSDINILKIFLAIFGIWFILESTLLVNPDIPMLKSRQMLSFIFGIYLAQNKNKTISLRVGLVNIIIGIIMMGVTQVDIVKNLNFLQYNILSLITVFPMAIGVLSITYKYKVLFQSKILFFISNISYEIYLVHQYSIDIFMKIKNYQGIIVFLLATLLLAYLLYLISNKFIKTLLRRSVNNDRFNGNYIN